MAKLAKKNVEAMSARRCRRIAVAPIELGVGCWASARTRLGHQANVSSPAAVPGRGFVGKKGDVVCPAADSMLAARGIAVCGVVFKPHQLGSKGDADQRPYAQRAR